MSELSLEVRAQIDGALRGWPTLESLRKSTQTWPIEWFDYGFERIQDVTNPAVQAVTLGKVKELREIRRAEIYQQRMEAAIECLSRKVESGPKKDWGFWVMLIATITAALTGILGIILGRMK